MKITMNSRGRRGRSWSSSSRLSSSSSPSSPPSTFSATRPPTLSTSTARTTVTLLASVWTVSVSLLFTSALSSEAAFTPQPGDFSSPNNNGGGGRRNNSGGPQKRPPIGPSPSSPAAGAGPLSSSSSSARNAASASTAAAMSSSSRASPKGVKPGQQRGRDVPLVDSTLLRYISEQKGATEIQLQSWEELMAGNNNGSDGMMMSSNADGTVPAAEQPTTGLLSDPDLPSGYMQQPEVPAVTTSDVISDTNTDIGESTTTLLSSSQSNFGSSTPSSTRSQRIARSGRITNVAASSPSLDVIKGQASSSKATSSVDEGVPNDRDNTDVSSSSSFLRQFNQHRVAQKLISLGADPELAKAAGESVQTHLLVRSARRRIRIFLRRRDHLWRDTSPVSNQQLLSFDPFASGGAGAYTGQTTAADPSLTSTSKPQDYLLSPSPPSSFSRDYGLDDVLDVMQEFGLSGVDICAILTHSPSIALMMPRRSRVKKDLTSSDETVDEMNVVPDAVVDDKSGETLEETLERSLNKILMKTLGLRRYDARKVLRDTPGLLTMKGSKSAEQIINMMAKLGVSEKSLSRDRFALPPLLSRPPAGMFRLISFLCGSSVRIPMNQIGPLLRRRGSRELMDAVVPIPASKRQVGYNRADDEDDNDKIDPITEPAFWSRSREERDRQIEAVYRNMTKTVSTIRNEIGTRDFSRVVAAYPSVLLLDAERQIMPVANFLMDELGIINGDLASVLELYPTLLGKDIDGMKNNIQYLEDIGVREDDLGSIFRAFPALLTMDIKDMSPVVDYLQSIGVNDVGAFVTSIPPILGYSVEKDLKPKWEFLETIYMHAGFELKKFPNYFSYPFERTIKTRYQYLALKGISRQLIPIDAVLRFGDVDFARTIARDVDGGETFLSFSKKRQQLTQTKNQQDTKKGPKRRRQKEAKASNGSPPNDQKRRFAS